MIGIINCDLDESPDTNGAHLMNRIIEESRIIDIVNGESVDFDSGYDGFIITGSRADFDDEYEWIVRLRGYIRKMRDRSIPCLGICFGMQMVTDVYGGTVMQNQVDEDGFFDIDFNKANNLFDGFNSPLKVYESHHDCVSRVPEDSVIIARNDNCIQAFLLDNFYCLQFHPEISAMVALEMAERDGDDSTEKLNGVSRDYSFPEQIFHNFVGICNASRS